MASGKGVGGGVGVAAGDGVVVGVGVGEGVTEGGGLNFGPGHPTRKIQVRSNAGSAGNGKLRTRIPGGRAGKTGFNVKTFGPRLGASLGLIGLCRDSIGFGSENFFR
jgi:hypothetical protein